MNRFWGFFKKEVIGLVRDPVLLVAVMVMPAVQLVVLSGAITLEANNMRIAMDAPAGDFAMEKIYDHAIGSGWFVPMPDTDMDATRAVQSGNAAVAIVAPAGGLPTSVARGDGRIQVLIDSMNILKAQSIEAYLGGIIMGTARDLGYNMPPPQIDFKQRILFNPELNTKWFMVPALIAILVFLSLLILITISITKEKEAGTMETLISAPISKYDIIAGKVVPYILVTFLVMLSILAIGLWMFHIPFAGSGAMFVLGYVVFCVPATAAAVWLSDYTHTQQQALLGVVIVSFMALMLSGAMVPTDNMPRILRGISYLNPLSHYSDIVRDVMLKGSDWYGFWRQCLAMLGAGVILWIFAVRKFKTTL